MRRIPRSILPTTIGRILIRVRLGAFPAGASGDKYWCPVNRIDNVYGDRNLVCTCPPMESYSEAAQ